jgi:transcriptional regulator with XRE-family HTH domain
MDGSEKRRLLLNKIMDEKGVSAIELSKRTKIKESTISQYRSGTKKLNGVKTLERLANGLGEHESIFFPDPRKMDGTERAVRELKQELSDIKTMLNIASATTPIDTASPFPRAAVRLSAPRGRIHQAGKLSDRHYRSILCLGTHSSF